MTLTILRKPAAIALGAIFGILMATKARAAVDFDPQDVSALTQELSRQLIRTVAVGTDHRSMMPATPLGSVLGIDIGMEAAAIKVPEEFREALKTAGAGGENLEYLPLVRLNINKGLPWGLDVGFSYVGYEDNKLVSASLQWAFLKPKLGPNVAIRGSRTVSRLYFMTARSWKFDVVASKSFGYFIDPYVGAGVQFYSGTLDVPASGQPGGLPAGVTGEDSGSPAHLFVGLPLKLFFIKLTGEYDYSFAGISTVSAKVSLYF